MPWPNRWNGQTGLERNRPGPSPGGVLRVVPTTRCPIVRHATPLTTAPSPCRDPASLIRLTQECRLRTSIRPLLRRHHRHPLLMIPTVMITPWIMENQEEETSRWIS